MPSNDPLGAVFPGDEPPNSARGWNAYNAAARRTRQNVLGDAPGGEPLLLPAEPANLVFVQAGGDGVEPWTVSRYGETPLDLAVDEDTGRRRPVYADGTPTNSTDPVVITVEAAGAGENARAVCAGVARCRVNVTSTSHAFAVPIAGDRTKLVSDDTSGYPIVAREGGTGTQWAQVLLGAGAGTAANLTSCRDRLAGLDPATDRITFKIIPGSASGLCAEIEAATLVGYAPDPEVERWVSVGTFPTKLGDTSLTYQYDDATGDPVVILTGTTGEGSGATTVIQPLKYVRCVNGCEEYAARPLLWCDSAPVADCALCPDGAPRRYRTTLAGGTGGYAAMNGEHTFKYSTGCQWDITTPGFTGSAQWVDQGGGTKQLQTQINHDASGAFVSWNGPVVSVDADCCGAVAGVEYADFDPGSGGAGDTPPVPTVTAVGPCVREWCADNAFKVRVCCKGHTRYTGCDALPDYSGGWCLYGTNWSSGETLGGTLLGNYGPAAGSGAVAVLYCGVGPGNGYDETRVVCGWRIIGTAESAGDAVSWAAINNVGMWGVNTFAVVVYYDPDADDGAGAWVLGQLNYASFGTECTLNVVATAANDPDPTDDPFEIVFMVPYGVGTYHTLRFEQGPCDEAGGGGSGGEAELDDGCCAGPGEALSGDPPPSLRITILDGAFAGVYDVPYVVGLGGQGGWSATSGGNTWVVYCADADPGPGQIWQVLLNGGGGTVLSVTCSPFGLVVDKSLVGSTADFVVSVTP